MLAKKLQSTPYQAAIDQHRSGCGQGATQGVGRQGQAPGLAGFNHLHHVAHVVDPAVTQLDAQAYGSKGGRQQDGDGKQRAVRRGQGRVDAQGGCADCEQQECE